MRAGPVTIVLRALHGGAPGGLAVVCHPGELVTVRDLDGPSLQALVAVEVNLGPLFQVVSDEIQESCRVTRAHPETGCGADRCNLPRGSPAHGEISIFSRH